MGLFPISLNASQFSRSAQRSGSHQSSFSSLRYCECGFQPASSLAPVPTRLPEPPERSTEAQSFLTLPVCNQPVQGNSQVQLFSIQSSQPQELLHSPEMWLGFLHQRKVIICMRFSDALLLSTLTQAFQPIFAPSYQHGEAWFFFLSLDPPHQACIHEASDAI